MTSLLANNQHKSALRQAKYTQNMNTRGFKRVQRWVFDIENATIQEKIKADLANYKITQDEQDWNAFALDQLENLEGWK